MVPFLCKQVRYIFTKHKKREKHMYYIIYVVIYGSVYIPNLLHMWKRVRVLHKISKRALILYKYLSYEHRLS